MSSTSDSHKRITGRLIALSSSAVLSIYAAGYVRTRPAANRIAEAQDRRVVVPGPVQAGAALDMPRPLPVSTRPVETAPSDSPTEIRATAALPAKRHRTNDTGRSSAPDASTSAAPGTAVSAPVAAEARPSTAPAESTTVAPIAAVLPAAPTPAAQPPQVVLKDGTYLGWGSCRHGDIQASVVVEAGRIASATIAQCETRYPCSWIANLPSQVVSRQSPNVDYVSGATQSTDAFYYAVIDALSKAK